MFSRLNQLVRHLSRPLPNYSHTSAAAVGKPPVLSNNIMTSSIAATATTPNERNKKLIQTAGCIIIGDEVLGGKTVDTNSSYFAKFCFALGINLKRIEVIADDEEEIAETTRRMSKNYDFVVTSGGIGPTHDDITYQSISKAFNLKLELHEPSFERMKRLSRPHRSQPNFSWDKPSPDLDAKLRMVYLPYDKSRSWDSQVTFVDDNMWVPVSVVNGNVHILPGVPSLFRQLLDGLKPNITPRLADPTGAGIYRILISTPKAESAIAAFLTELSHKAEPRGVKVGSYPRWGKSRNTVTLVGTDKEFMESLVSEVEKGVSGKRVQVEDEVDTDGEEQGSQ
ncbi:MAG: hypothetical protein M1834_007630 [Cirrosporium novae-zelandiae]|nr:MAG: hypothetical protein M1834_007630 [Cirrosporium novae-zelandiae]